MLDPENRVQSSAASAQDDQAKAEMERRAKEYISKQKKKMAAAIIILVSVAILMLTWKIYSVDSQKQMEKKQISDQRVAEIQKNMQTGAASASNQDANAKQQSIVAAITQSQPLPVKIDDITVISNLYFKDNSLTFEVTIDSSRMKKEEQDRMNDPETISGILQKNKPVACSIMKNLSSWEGNWTISYIYYFLDPRKEIGRTQFSSDKCL